MIQNATISRLIIWRSAIIFSAVSLAFGLLLCLSGQTRAQAAGHTMIAHLTGPAIGGMTPVGSGRFNVQPNTGAVFEADVANIGLPGGALLGVFVDGNPVGQIHLSPLGTGSLFLSSRGGQTVPMVHEGSPITVRHGGQVILGGVFTEPPPPPNVALFALLVGPTVNGSMPRGVAQYVEFPDARRLGVFVNNIHLPAGTSLTVTINDSPVGDITLNDRGEGALRLNTANGDVVPVIAEGDTAAVADGNTELLSGAFRNVIHPPSPPPHPNRVFGGRLGGGQVVPPVETEAHGLIRIVVDPDDAQIRVSCGFFGLSSDQTSATINGPAMPGEVGPVIFDLGMIGGTQGRFPIQTFNISADQAADLRNGLWYVQIGSVDHPDGEIRGQIHSLTRPGGFTGSESEDIAVFRPSSGTWYVRNEGGYSAQVLGQAGDSAVSGDFDGDGQTDYAVFRDGTWIVRRSSDQGLTTEHYGTVGDIPVRGDYDGDGQSDLAVFRPSTGVWYIQKSDRSGQIAVQFGISGDVPVASDFDGDGRTDIAVFRPSSGVWYWLRSSNGSAGAAQFGTVDDLPIAGDFDSDGVDDLAVFRPSNGVWYILRSSDASYDIRQFGVAGDMPVAANYDGDGVADIAVFRPSTGIWYIWQSSDNSFDYKYFGLSGDVPATQN
jgi:hypothetical protein